MGAMRRAGGTARGERTRPWLAGVLRCGALLAAAALAVLPLTTSAAYAATGGDSGATVAPSTGASAGAAASAGASAAAKADAANAAKAQHAQSLTSAEAALQPILDHLHSAYQQAEVETQKYDGLAEQLTQARSDDTALLVQVQNAQSQVNDGMTIAGEIAEAQYRNGGLSQLGELLLTNDPEQALHTEQLLRMAATSQAKFLAQLRNDQSNLATAKYAADVAEAQAGTLLAAEAAQRKVINDQLAAVEKQVASLTGAQQQELELLEQKDANAAQVALLASGILGKDDGKPSAAGAEAIAFAFAQLGAPYVWGGVGPYAAGFDCSGLTSQAWLAAGVAIPRTSEEQWAELPHVALDALRPGDLIIYFSGASHVAMYIGNGMVIEAPHTGAFVDVEPMAVDPILGAVRPDGSDSSLSSYTPPVIPPSAEKPQPLAPVAPTTPPATKPTPKPTTKPKPRPSGSGSPSPTPSGSGTPTPSPTPSGSTAASPSPSDTPSTPAASTSATAVDSASAFVPGSASGTAAPSGSAGR